MNNGMDALDSLLCFGYRVVRGDDPILGTAYKLCGSGVNINDIDMKSLHELFDEINMGKEYYANRIISIGRKLK